VDGFVDAVGEDELVGFETEVFGYDLLDGCCGAF
jgi:hypothetical protein